MSATLENILAHLKKHQTKQSDAWEIVQNDARKYAQMKTFGTYVEGHGGTVAVHVRERDNYAKHFADRLLESVVYAFQQDALMGVAVADVLNVKE